MNARGVSRRNSNLAKLVGRRLEWETLREFTFGSGIGRTLERTGAAAVALDRERVQKAYRTAHTRIREEVGGLREMGEDTVRSLVLGVLRHMKDRGAVRHALMDGVSERAAGILGFGTMIRALPQVRAAIADSRLSQCAPRPTGSRCVHPDRARVPTKA